MKRIKSKIGLLFFLSSFLFLFSLFLLLSSFVTIDPRGVK